MKQEFSDLLKLLNLINIRLVESKESVVSNTGDTFAENDNIELNTKVGLEQNSPEFINSKNILMFNLRYVFTVSKNGENYFNATYIYVVSFTVSDKEKFDKLYRNDDVKEIFIKKQLHRTLWTILRGTLLDAFNRHSLQPITLPWLL